MNTLERSLVQSLLDVYKAIPEGSANTTAMGLLVARFFHWDGLDILRAAQHALEDSNLHTHAAQLAAMADAMTKADDDELIDSVTRSAVFASLAEVYPGIQKDRARRLAKLNLLANRPADNPITSLSDRYCDMTMGDARRVFDMLNEMRELSA